MHLFCNSLHFTEVIKLTCTCTTRLISVKHNTVLIHLFLKKLKASFVFPQKNLSLISILLKKRLGVASLSHFQLKSRGCGILVHKSTPFAVSQVIEDHKGRYVILPGTLFSTPIIPANVCAPNYDDVTFMLPFRSPVVVDFSCVMCPQLELSSKNFFQ